MLPRGRELVPVPCRNKRWTELGSKGVTFVPSKQLVGKLGAQLGQGCGLSRGSCERSVGSLGLSLLCCGLCCWGARLLPWCVYTQPCVPVPRLFIPVSSRYQIKIPPRCLKSSYTSLSRRGKSADVIGSGGEVNNLSLAQCLAETAVWRNLVLFGFLRGSNWEYRMSGDTCFSVFLSPLKKSSHARQNFQSEKDFFFQNSSNTHSFHFSWVADDFAGHLFSMKLRIPCLLNSSFSVMLSAKVWARVD